MSKASKTQVGNGRRLRTGVPEIDGLLRRVVYKQGGRAQRGSHGLTIIGPNGKDKATITASKVHVTSLGAIRSRLRRIGFKIR